MPTRKIMDYDYREKTPIKGPCLHPDHNPPLYRVLEPAEYEHICPHCGKVTRFTVLS